jgi:hypothetical protein
VSFSAAPLSRLTGASKFAVTIVFAKAAMRRQVEEVSYTQDYMDANPEKVEYMMNSTATLEEFQAQGLREREWISRREGKSVRFKLADLDRILIRDAEDIDIARHMLRDLLPPERVVPMSAA